MALVKFGGGVVQMAGSIAGTTFARNRGGNYARARTKPINPNSPLQVIVRANLALLTVQWSSVLTAAQRTAWNLYASSVIMQNRLGESINLSGFNHFLRSNIVRLQAGASQVNDGPVIFEIPDADPTFAIVTTTATQIVSQTFDTALSWANEDSGHLFVFQGQPQNAQRNFFGGPWRFLNSIDGAGAGPPVSPEDSAAVFSVQTGQHIWAYGRISRADGRLSAPFRDDVFGTA